MQHSEKLCLKWNDFQENVNSAFRNQRNDQEFSDVTLACEDGTQIETHKVILASSSPFFMEILKRNKHPHPFIYLRGIKSEELVAIIDFLYVGEANIYQESLDAFLGLAEELRLKGLTGSAELNGENVSKAPPEKKVTQKKEETESTLNLLNPSDIYNPNGKIEPMTSVALVSADIQQLDEEVKSMMDISENMTPDGKQRARKCKVCGKEGWRRNIMTHIEANHITSNVSHSCDICGKIFRTKHSLRVHNGKQHLNSN